MSKCSSPPFLFSKKNMKKKKGQYIKRKNVFVNGEKIYVIEKNLLGI